MTKSEAIYLAKKHSAAFTDTVAHFDEEAKAIELVEDTIGSLKKAKDDNYIEALMKSGGAMHVKFLARAVYGVFAGSLLWSNAVQRTRIWLTNAAKAGIVEKTAKATYQLTQKGKEKVTAAEKETAGIKVLDAPIGLPAAKAVAAK